jgi:hypothetical protein
LLVEVFGHGLDGLDGLGRSAEILKVQRALVNRYGMQSLMVWT